jgi:bifunctional non-homologous end joining protein LigD
VRKIPGDFVLDGESIGDTFYTFDILEYGVTDLRDSPYKDRLVCLLNLLASVMQAHMVMVDTAFDSSAKRILLRDLKRQNKEGIVFKRIDAPYTPGRPNSGVSQLKHKFYATLSALVGTVNEKRSVEIRLRNGTRWVTAGNVTIPPNQTIPAVGQVVEVRYLYAFEESGSVYQPTYLGMRSDVLAIECVRSQLKFKNGEEEP